MCDRLTWCGDPKCTQVINLNKQPVNDRNGEALCRKHGEAELKRQGKSRR